MKDETQRKTKLRTKRKCTSRVLDLSRALSSKSLPAPEAHGRPTQRPPLIRMLPGHLPRGAGKQFGQRNTRSVTEGHRTTGTMSRAMLAVVSTPAQLERDHGSSMGRFAGGPSVVVATRRLIPPPMVKNVLSPATDPL